MSDSVNVIGAVGYMTHVYHVAGRGGSTRRPPNPGQQSSGAPQGNPVRAAQHPAPSWQPSACMEFESTDLSHVCRWNVGGGSIR